MRESEASIGFALIPNAVCWHPPIRHRNDESYWRRGVKPFQFYLLGGVLIAARAELESQRHLQSFAKGSRAIRKEVKTSERFLDSKESAEAYGWRTPGKGDGIKRAGSVTYKSHKKWLRKFTPDEVAVEITGRRLLQMSGIAVDSGNYRSIWSALNRMCRPAGAGGCEMPAPLRSFEHLSSGKLRLFVDGAWLPASKFKRVFWPPPKRSSAALALYLLVCVMDTRPTNNKEVTEQWLADRLGLDHAMSTGARRRAITAALDILNGHMRDLPDALIKQMWERKPRVNIPQAYTCEPLTEGKIRIVAVSRPRIYDPEKTETRPIGKKRSVKRKRLERAEDVGAFASNREKSVGDFASDERKVWESSHPGVGDFASNHDYEPQEQPVLQGFRRPFASPYMRKR